MYRVRREDGVEWIEKSGSSEELKLEAARTASNSEQRITRMTRTGASKKLLMRRFASFA